MTDFAILLETFFYKYLSVERGCSTNTVANYKDTFVSLFSFLSEERKLSPSKVKMEVFDSDLINSFLNWLEAEKRIAVSTRNNRLAGIKSFFRYVSLHEPAYLNRCNSILAIKAKTSYGKLSITRLSQEAQRVTEETAQDLPRQADVPCYGPVSHIQFLQTAF